MLYKQFIKNYKEDYKKYNGWLKKETSHYIFNYFDNKFIKEHINRISKIQENSNNKIFEFLGIRNAKKINYYIYPSEFLKSKYMGNPIYAQSVYKDYSVHIVYNKKIRPLGPHEDTHLISLKFGLPPSFFAEGLAESIASKKRFFNGKSRKYFIKKWLNKYDKDSLSNFFIQKGWLDTPDNESGEFYSIAMSFTLYLIKVFGKEKFFKLYKKINRNMTIKQIVYTMEKVFLMDYEQIISNWKI